MGSKLKLHAVGGVTNSNKEFWAVLRNYGQYLGITWCIWELWAEATNYKLQLEIVCSILGIVGIIGSIQELHSILK